MIKQIKFKLATFVVRSGLGRLCTCLNFDPSLRVAPIIRFFSSATTSPNEGKNNEEELAPKFIKPSEDNLFLDNDNNLVFARTFGKWKCSNCNNKWRSAYTWISLSFCLNNKKTCIERILDTDSNSRTNNLVFSGKKLNDNEFLSQSCQNCNNDNKVKIISYSNLKGGISKFIPHRSDLCLKCLKGFPCKKYFSTSSKLYYGAVAPGNYTFNSKRFYSTTPKAEQKLFTPLRITNWNLASSPSKYKIFSDLWCKEMVASLRLSGFDLWFEDMSNIDMKLLKDRAGIYMITNKINGKFYIGKSKDIANRFYAYLNINRLENNKNIRINRALLKYGYSNFSLTILEFIDLKRKQPAKKLTQRREYRDLIRKAFGLKSHDVLTLREDFFIKVFKPQYNMKRTSFNVDREISRTNYDQKITIPFKVKHLLENCLNSKVDNWRLIKFNFSSIKGILSIGAESYSSVLWAKSSGWNGEGEIRNADGFKVENKKIKGLKPLKEHTEFYKYFIDKKCLNSFFPPSKRSDFPQPSGKLMRHRPLDIGKTSFRSYYTNSRNLIPSTEDKKPNNNIFLKRAIYNFIKASVNNKIPGLYFQDSTVLITFLREFDPDFKMSKQSVHNYKKRKLVFKPFLINTDVSRFFTYVKSRFPEFNPSAFMEECSGTRSPKPNVAGYAGLLKFYRSLSWASRPSGFLPLRPDIPSEAQKSTRYYSKKASNKNRPSAGGFADKDLLDNELGKVYKKGFVATFFNFDDWIKKVKLELHPEWNKNEAPMAKPRYLRLIKRKPGIYMFTNNITHNRFIGMSSNLLGTFLNYNSKSFPDKNPNSRIQRAIRKHGYANFSISILEYCNAPELQNKKQYYINVMKPQYNI